MNPTIAGQLVCDGLLELAHTVRGDPSRLNERYIQHEFSYLMQSRGLSLGLNGAPAMLHPEWPTCNEAASIAYARFRRREMPLTWQYEVDEDGRAGLLDFAVGPYAAPWAGVELTLRRDWMHEEAVFNLMKLLHPGLPFEVAASLSVFFSPGRRVLRGTHTARVVIPAAFEAAVHRLKSAGLPATPRPLLALFVEVLDSGERAVWRLTCRGEAEELPITRLSPTQSQAAAQPCRW